MRLLSIDWPTHDRAHALRHNRPRSRAETPRMSTDTGRIAQMLATMFTLQDEHNRLIAMWREGVPSSKIGMALGRTNGAVIQYAVLLRKSGVCLEKRSPTHWTPEQESLLVSMWESDVPAGSPAPWLHGHGASRGRAASGGPVVPFAWREIPIGTPACRRVRLAGPWP